MLILPKHSFIKRLGVLQLSCYINVWNLYRRNFAVTKKYLNHGCPVGRELSSGPGGSGSRSDETPPCPLMTPGTCKIPSWVLCSPISHSNYTSRDNKMGKPSPLWWIKFLMLCQQTILRDKPQTVGNSPIHYSSPFLNPNFLPTYLTIYQRRINISKFYF